MSTSASDWIGQFAASLGIPAPSDAEATALLELAGVAAHASERTAAPISCWLAASAGVSPADALAAAQLLAARQAGN